MENQTIEVVNLREIILPVSLIRKIPAELIKQYQFIPIGLKDGVLTCAFGALPEQRIISDIIYATTYKVRIVLALKDEIQESLKELFPETEPQPKYKLEYGPMYFGGIRRLPYFLGICVLAVCYVSMTSLFPQNQFLPLVLSGVVYVLQIILGVNRLHNMGRSGWWLIGPIIVTAYTTIGHIGNQIQQYMDSTPTLLVISGWIVFIGPALLIQLFKHRLHDIGMNGRWLLAFSVPLVNYGAGLIIALQLLFIPEGYYNTSCRLGNKGDMESV